MCPSNGCWNEIRRVSEKKLDRFLRENVIKRSVRPVSERYSAFTDYDVFEYDMEKDGQEHELYAFNEAVVMRSSAQAARLETIMFDLQAKKKVTYCLVKILHLSTT